MNNKPDRMWKKVCGVSIPAAAWEDGGKSQEISVTAAGLPVEIGIPDLPNSPPRVFPLNRDVQ
jgi:hypothetical protein